MNNDSSELIDKANKIFAKNFKPETHFERAVFFSWHCDIRSCKFCYMSTQPKPDSKKNIRQIARRSTESLLAEILICRLCGWKIGFFSGGIGAFNCDEFRELVKLASLFAGEKLWLNVGALSKKELQDYLPYCKGVVGSIETPNKTIHKEVCPDKPVEPYFRMFEEANKLGLKTAATIILGLGETIEDFESLKNIIKKYEISKIHFYGLNPHKGTAFENSLPPTNEYQAEWIAKTRIEFPNINIQCGIWEDRADYLPLLLNAGANSISKFPAIRKFSKKQAKEVGSQAKKAGRKFLGTLTKMPSAQAVKKEFERINKLCEDKELITKVKEKLNKYLKSMKK